MKAVCALNIEKKVRDVFPSYRISLLPSTLLLFGRVRSSVLLLHLLHDTMRNQPHFEHGTAGCHAISHEDFVALGQELLKLFLGN